METPTSPPPAAPASASPPPPGTILAAGIMIALAIGDLGWVVSGAPGRFWPQGSWMTPVGLGAIKDLLLALANLAMLTVGFGLIVRPRWAGAALVTVLARGLVPIVFAVVEARRFGGVLMDGTVILMYALETLVLFLLLFGVWVALRRRGERSIRATMGRRLLMASEGIAACALVGMFTYMAAVVPRSMAGLYEADAPVDAAGRRAAREADSFDATAGEDIDLVPDVDPALFRTSLDAVSGGTKPLWEEGASATLVDFWASWCPPCLAELPHLEAVQKRLADRGVRVVLVNVDLGDRGRVGGFLSKKGITLDSLVDEDGALFEAAGLEALPSAFVLDRSGKVVEFIEGGMDEEELAAFLLRANEKRVREVFR